MLKPFHFFHVRRRARQRVKPTFFSGANTQQYTMHAHLRMYSQNQISRKWLVWVSDRMRIIMLYFGKMERFSVM